MEASKMDRSEITIHDSSFSKTQNVASLFVPIFATRSPKDGDESTTMGNKEGSHQSSTQKYTDITMTPNNNTNETRVRFDSDNLSDLTASIPMASALAASSKQQEHDATTSSSPPPPPRHLTSAPPTTLAPTPMQQQQHHHTPKFQAKDLRGNLMRELTNRDPLFNYEVVKVLGVGSMGSVAKVRKRGSAIGGSARKELQQHFTRERRLRQCAEIPVFGPMFSQCLKGWHTVVTKMTTAGDNDDDLSNSLRSANSVTSSILNPKGNLLEPVDDEATSSGGRSSNYELLYAMKSIHLSRVTDPSFVQELRNEVRILRDVDHPHIVRPIETYEHRHQIFIVMELCSGGDLYTRDPYTEPEAARIVGNILSAISYMHSRNISHRDLKYENIMFINNEPKAEVKLIDFGLSKKFGPGEDLTEGVGTIYTMAPEVLKGKYTAQADIWSIGVIAYMLLSSQMPFFGRKRKHIVESIMKGSFDFKGRRWKRLSAQSKEFVKSLLVVDPEERLDADEALSDIWLNRRLTATVRNPYEEEIEGATNSIVRYANYSKLKKMALMVVAHKSSTQEIGILRKIFQKYDTKKDGQLSYEEFKAALGDAGVAEDECERIFDSVDLDGTGTIRYTEFLASTLETMGAISEERLAEAFDRIDADDSGYISAENLKALLGTDFPKEEIDAIIKEADLTKDGKISYSEFLALWEDKNETRHRDTILSIRALADEYEDISERSSNMSDHAIEEDGPDLTARANFLEEKRLSERKAAAGDVADESKHEETDGSKRVGFSEDVSTIPAKGEEQNGANMSDPVANDEKETLMLQQSSA